MINVETKALSSLGFRVSLIWGGNPNTELQELVIYVIDQTCALPATTGQNVCCEKRPIAGHGDIPAETKPSHTHKRKYTHKSSETKGRVQRELRGPG